MIQRPPLDISDINAQLTATSREQLDDILLFDKIPSTNSYLLQYAKSHHLKNIVCIANQQTQGKAQHGRAWLSPPDCNIYFSLLWHFPQPVNALQGLSLVVGIALINAIKTCLVDTTKLKIKWPNDIYWDAKKLAGILVEIAETSQNNTSVVIGIGLNVYHPNIDTSSIHQPWTCLETIANKIISRNLIIANLINELNNALLQFTQCGFTSFLQHWKQWDYLYGKRVTAQIQEKSYHGVAKGINQFGELLLHTDTGHTRKLVSASLRAH